jgi:hypothetical protein
MVTIKKVIIRRKETESRGKRGEGNWKNEQNMGREMRLKR